MMQSVLSLLKEHKNTLLKLLPLMAFAVPLLWLYLLHPASFELMWKGRTFQLFFVWLIALELILSWENIQPNKIAKRALHFYYGPLYSIAWIVAYPLITLLSQSLWRKITSKANGKKPSAAAKEIHT
jgi:hypothetical protein